jgi:hypothetical protein
MDHAELSLALHPSSVGGTVRAIDVALLRNASTLTLSYVLHADMARIHWPERRAPARWRPARQRFTMGMTM